MAREPSLLHRLAPELPGGGPGVPGYLQRHRFAVDAASAIAFGALCLLLANTFIAPAAGTTALGARFWSVAMALPLVWRRTAPLPATAATAVIATAHLIAGFPLLLPADLAVLIMLFTVTVQGPVWAHRAAILTALFGAAAVALWLVGHTGIGTLSEAGTIFAFCAVIALATWAFALNRRSRRETLAALRERTARLEVERDQQAMLATAAERARIAREMHDVVAHSLSVVIAQADGARYAAGADPAIATQALGTIATTARSALGEMRSLLGMLRDDDGGGELAPLPSDGDLAPLIAASRAAGLVIDFQVEGRPRPLGRATALNLQRVCQEALSNVRKHAGPQVRVWIVQRWRASEVELEVSDNGRGAASNPAEAGYGLVGMRERAALLGGSVQAGPRPGGGWTIRFRAPIN